MKKLKNVYKMILGTSLAILMVILVGVIEPEEANSTELVNNSETGTWCWVGTCGHPKRYITYYTNSSGKKYFKAVSGTDYQYLNRYIEPGNNATISFQVTYLLTYTIGSEIGTDICKVATSTEKGINNSWGYADNVYNTTRSRLYVHAGVEYETRRSYGVEIENRIYNPCEYLTAFNKYCEYDSKMYYPLVKVPTGEGYSLLTTKKSCSLIKYK